MDKNRIKLIRSLTNRKHRLESGLFIAEGTKLVYELLNSNLTVVELFYTSKHDINIPNFKEIKSENISEEQMGRISALKTPTSILALVEIPHSHDIHIESDQLYLALDGVQDPGNMGTIIRLADWFGIKHIFCSNDSVDIYNPKVVQATMGAIARVGVSYLDLPQFLNATKHKSVQIYTTALDGDDIYNCPLTKGGIIVMGNEGKGVSKEILELSTSKLYIPSFSESSTSESLNVGIATAVVCAEFRRRAR